MAKITLNNVRLAFPHVFDPQSPKDGKGESKYNACFIIDPASPEASKLAKLVEQVAKDKWLDKAAGVLAQLRKADKVCYREDEKVKGDGDVYDGFEGMHYVQASDAARPTVVDRDRTPLAKKDGKIYAGCYVNAIIDVWAQDSKDYGRRVNASLKGVQFVAHGDSFGGSAPASADEFEDLGAGADSEDFC